MSMSQMVTLPMSALASLLTVLLANLAATSSTVAHPHEGLLQAFDCAVWSES